MKKNKVIVIGLPKTGTSTLAAMLRMLGYSVTGPEIHYKHGDYHYLDQQFHRYDAFQDFPWCFEWERYFDDPNVKFIILKRDPESWWKSFFESYGRKGGKYLSYPYMNLQKISENKDVFLRFNQNYYANVNRVAEVHPYRFLSVTINDFKWDDLCDFLEQPIPRTLFGQTAKKPHVNQQKSKVARTRKYRILNAVKKKVVLAIGQQRWHDCIVFLRKNNLIK